MSGFWLLGRMALRRDKVKPKEVARNGSSGRPIRTRGYAVNRPNSLSLTTDMQFVVFDLNIVCYIIIFVVLYLQGNISLRKTFDLKYPAAPA